MQKMPRPNNLQHSNSSSADHKDSSKNISLVLADLLDDYDYNQRPGYGGECLFGGGLDGEALVGVIAPTCTRKKCKQKLKFETTN